MDILLPHLQRRVPAQKPAIPCTSILVREEIQVFASLKCQLRKDPEYLSRVLDSASFESVARLKFAKLLLRRPFLVLLLLVLD